MIGKNAFQDCDNLVVVYQDGVANKDIFIKDYAFQNCRNLERIHLHSYLNLQGEKIFQNCNNLLNFGSSKIRNCSRILPYLFSGCTRLEEVAFVGKNKLQISDLTFSTCYNLKRMYFWGNVDITDYVKEIFEKLKIYCNSTSNVLDLAYEGFDIINMEAEK